MLRKEPIDRRAGVHYTAADFGPADGWNAFGYDHPRMKREIPGKFFLQAPLGLTGAELSINSLPPGVAVPFLHAHREHEELYFFLGGEGEMQVDGEKIPVRAGSAVRVAPAGARSWRNTGAVPLTYLVLQVKAGSRPASTIDDGVLIDGPVLW